MRKRHSPAEVGAVLGAVSGSYQQRRGTLGDVGRSESAITLLVLWFLYRDLVSVVVRREFHHRVGHPAIVIIPLALARKHE
jgi:hypothetical protein